MPNLDLLTLAKWLIVAALVVAAVVALASLGGSLAGSGSDAIGHFLNTYQGHTDPSVPGDGASEMSPQEWAFSFVLSQFGSIWSVVFTMVAAFVVAFGAFVIVRYVLRAAS